MNAAAHKEEKQVLRVTTNKESAPIGDGIRTRISRIMNPAAVLDRYYILISQKTRQELRDDWLNRGKYRVYVLLSVVGLGDVVEKRARNATKVEPGTLLSQVVQALQDLYGDGGKEENPWTKYSLDGVQLTTKPRVSPYKRSRPINRPRLLYSHLEKIPVFPFSWREDSSELKTIHSRILSPDIHSHAFLVDAKNGKSVSDAYDHDFKRKLFATPEHASNSPLHTRVGPRIYSQPQKDGRYHGPDTLIGPEFVVRGAEPIATISMVNKKVHTKRKVLVVLLNGKKLEITCDTASVTFGDVFQVVASRESLELSVTLGLACLVRDDFVFPPAEFKIAKIAPPNWSKPKAQYPPPFTVYLRFKLYLPSLRGTRSWKWKHLLYLQLRRLLLERQLRAEKQQLLALAGLALQAEFGDYSSLHQVDSDSCSYFLPEHYLPDEECGAYELSLLHRHRAGLDPGRAEEMFITHAMSLTEYGTQYISALLVGKEENNAEVWAGINSNGLVLCNKRDFTANMVRHPQYVFNWPDIKKLSYSKHHFEIASAESKFKLKLESNKSLYLFRMAWFHHKFFTKLSNEYTSLQNLTEEFGPKSKEFTKNVLHVSPDGSKKTESSALRRAASLLSPDRAIFRGKTATHCGRTCRSESYREIKAKAANSLPSSPPSSALSTLSYHSLTSTPQLSDETGSRGHGARRRVLMGTRAILSFSQHDLRSSSHSDLDSASPLPEAYVLNMNIKTNNDQYAAELNDTISGSLAEKFNEVSFSHDRILVTVTVLRDSYGSFGLQVVEGKDGHAYIISAIPGSPAHKTGLIHSGDQIQAVNGHNVLSSTYTEVLKCVQNSGKSVELLLSQMSNGRKAIAAANNKTAPKIKITDSTGFDLMTVLQKPIEESYLNAIRYQIATESDDSMIATELPQPLSYL